MDPDTASLDLLRSCAKLAKDSRIQKHIPEEQRNVSATHVDRTIELKESLAKKELSCGDGTLDGCGKFCLNSSGAIPQVCRDIAQKFFGEDGVNELENAHRQVGNLADKYSEKSDNVVFTTITGKVLGNLEEIGKYMEEEGRNGNVEAVEKGMDFMVKKGFVKPEEKDFALQFVRKIKERGGQIDFDACDKDPESCREFIPDNRREEFDVKDQIHKISALEIGFDPRECSRGDFDANIGKRCYEGTKRALPKLDALTVGSPEAGRIVGDLKKMLLDYEERQC